MSGPAPLVAVFVGTDHHRFDRLLGWVEELGGSGLDFFVQHGSTPLPTRLRGAPMLGPAELDALLRRASAVVTHGGPGSIMDARERGHVPVVVARDPLLGEHVDDHQQRFVAHVGRTGMVLAADDLACFEARIREAVVLGRRPLEPERRGRTMARFEQLVDGLVRR